MKKLMAMLVSLACASGAWATADKTQVYPTGVDFDSVEIKEGKTEADYDISGDAKWSGATGSDDALKVMAWGDGDYSGGYPERLTTSSSVEKNYLSLETGFTTPLYRAVKDNMAADDTYGEQVYIDALVNLTAGEAASLGGADLASDARIALWLQEGDADVEDSTPVLCVKAAKYDSEAGSYSSMVFSNTWTVAAGWHRLTVRCFKDVTRTGKAIPAYAVYVDGKAVTTSVKAFSDATDFVPKCATLAANGSLFGSLQGAGSGTAEQTIKAVGFAGNGKIDDIIFTTTKPSLTGIDDTNYFHLTWDDGVKSISYVIGDGQSVTVEGVTEGEAGATDIALTGEAMAIAVSVTYSENHGKGVWTADGGAGVEDGATTFTINAGSLTPSGAIVSASTVSVGSAVVTIDGTALETITATTLSGLIEAIGTAIGDKTLADTDTIYIKLADNVEFDNESEDYISLGTTAGVWTLDLNGKTVTCNASEGGLQAIVNMGTLVVTDSSSGKSGKIAFADAEKIGSAVYNYASERNAVLTIEAGTFDGNVSGDVDESASASVTSTIAITGGKFLASANQTEGDAPEFSLKSCVDAEKYSITLTDGYYVVASGGSEPVETAVAKIGENGYTTLQDAVDQAVKDATAEKPVTIEIVSDIPITETLVIKGTDADTTKITINNNYAVTVNPVDGTLAGITIDAATVTFTGTGSWMRSSGSKLFIDVGSDVTVSTNAVANFNGGTFVNKSSGHVVNVGNGSAVVDGASFEVAGTGSWCVRAEVADNKTTAGQVLVKSGTFKGPTTGGTVALVGIKNAESVAAGAEVMIDCEGAITVVGSAKAADLMGEYLVTKTGDDEYTYTDDYKFKLNAEKGENTYTIAAIQWKTLTITWDAGIQSITVTESDNISTNLDLTAINSYAPKYDPDDNLTVTLTVTPQNGYTLNNAESDLTNIATTESTTIALTTTKSMPTTYDPGEVEKTTYETESAAAEEVTKINDAIKDGTASINAPTGLSDDAITAYKALFAAKVVTVTDGSSTSYQVKIDFTDQATSDLQTQVDGDVKLVELTKIAAAADDANVETEITTTPGLWYTVYAGNDLTSELTATSCKQATDAKTKLEFPKKGTRGFYKIGVSISSTLLQNQQ